jgi:hypothetical protein
MRRFSSRILALLAFLVATSALDGGLFADEKPLANADVIAIAAAGLGDDVAISKIQQAPKEALEVSTDALIALKRAGVSKPVIDAMIKRVAQRSSSAVASSDKPSLTQEKIYPVPDYDNTPFYYDSASSTLVELDAVQAVIGRRPRGFTGAEAAVYLSGQHAKVKVGKGVTQFIVKLKPGVDPKTLIDLNQAKVNEDDNRREYVVYKQGFITAEGTNPTVDIAIKPFGTGLYLVTPKTSLATGEYFFSLFENQKSRIVYAFSVSQ